LEQHGKVVHHMWWMHGQKVKVLKNGCGLTRGGGPRLDHSAKTDVGDLGRQRFVEKDVGRLYVQMKDLWHSQQSNGNYF
jgi:hypothetical protein